jgi:prostaglandin-endoperoxide synthase 2
MINTLLLREHNRLAHDIGLAHPEWDGDRVFETVRNCMIVMFIKIVVEEYINHISPIPLDFVADPSVAWNARWNKPNWITTEFSLLYRWHSLIPDTIRLNGQVRPVHTTFMDNRPLLNGGLLNSFRDIAGQRAGQLGPRNTTPALLHLERAAIEQGRLARLAPYADYKAYMSKTGRRPQRFEDVSSDPDVIAVLRAAYRDVGDIEFYVGLFAEDADPNSPLPKLLGEMVAVDAFSQALTNPLLSKHVMSRRTDAFSTVGWEAVAATSTLRDVLRRHVAAGTDVDDITMDVRA